MMAIQYHIPLLKRNEYCAKPILCLTLGFDVLPVLVYEVQFADIG